MKTILVGTTNPSKAAYFMDLLSGCDAQFVTLRDLGITDEPEESGNTPEENARIKAAFYGKYADDVVCADSGLYFDALALDDPRQPGLHIRTPGGCARLDDDQMIAHYAQLARSLGGRALAYYLNGIAVKNEKGIHSYLASREEAMSWAFYLVDTPSSWRREGWPLDSLSIDLKGYYFLDPQRKMDPQMDNSGTPRMKRFLMEKFGL